MNAAPEPLGRRRARRAAAASALLLLAAGRAGVARAEDAAAGAEGTRAVGQRSFCLGPTVGFWSGLGAIVGGGTETARAWFAAGYAPVLVFANARTPDKAVRFNYYSAYQLQGDLTVRLMQRARTDLALLLGYKFNSVLGHGGGAGVRILYDLGERSALEISAGLAVFPSAESRLDLRGYPADRSPPITPAIQGGASIGYLVFP